MSMLYLKYFLLIVLTTIIHSRGDDSGKIKGGRAAKLGQFPFMGHVVFLMSLNEAKLCGCALVTVNKIVTAGHCVMKISQGGKHMYDVNKGKVYFGTLQLMGNDGQKSRIMSVNVPKGIRLRRDGGYMHDYATAHLVNPIQLTDTVMTMKVYSKDKAEFKKGWNQVVTSGGTCIALGWGATDFKIVDDVVVANAASKYLKMTDVKPWTEKECNEYASLAEDDMIPFGDICLLAVTHGETVLPGDSGSPLLCGDYVWAVANSMTIDSSGNAPFHYLLHWHYLHEYLFPLGSGSNRQEMLNPLILLIWFLTF